jgi:hypothetical protein
MLNERRNEEIEIFFTSLFHDIRSPSANVGDAYGDLISMSICSVLVRSGRKLRKPFFFYIKNMEYKATVDGTDEKREFYQYYIFLFFLNIFAYLIY